MISHIRCARVKTFGRLALRVLIYLIVLSGCAALTTPSASAQQDYLQKLGRPSADTSMPVQNGAISLANGNLHIEIPMASLPGFRGKSVPVKLVYDSRLWTTLFTNTGWGYFPATPFNALGGWRVIQDNAGALTPCNNTIYRVVCDVGPSETAAYGQCTYDSIHYHDFVQHGGFSWQGPNGETKTFTNLSTLQTDQTPTGACAGPDTPSSDAYDDEGTGYHMFVTNYDNMVVYDNNGNLDYASSYLGTPVVTQSGNIMYFDFPNATSPTGTSRFTLTTTTINVSTAFGAPYTAEFSGPITVVQSLQLPNGQTYTFGYDSGTTPGHFGSLTSMTLPTGAEVQYGFSPFIDANCGFNVWATSYTSLGHAWSAQPSNTTPATLCGFFDQTVGSGQHVNVSRPDGSYSVYQFATPDRVTIYNTTTQHFDTTGALLETDLKDYITSYSFPGRITTTLSTSGGGSISKKIEYDYDSPYWNNVSEVREWDWSASSPTRVTHSYYTAAIPGYLAANILNLPTSVVVKDGSGNIFAQTAFTYDTQPNGNVLQESHWLNTGNTWLNTFYTYDASRNQISETDPNGNLPTTYSYTDNFTDGINHSTNAFLTQITYPSVNGVNHVERKQYDFNTGLLTAACGENFGGSTCARGLSAPQSDYLSHSYDLMGRLLTTVRGDGGQDTVTYNDSSFPLSITSATTFDASHNPVATTITDNLGRPVQRQVNSAISTETTYDSMGRVATVSNPHFSTTSATDGITSTAYDGLGRVTKVTAQDGGQTVTSYSGNSTTVVDPAGKQRRSFTDGLGRLIEVDEPTSNAVGTSGSGSATASGSEQSIPPGIAHAGSGTVTIGGSEQTSQVEQDPTCTLYDCGGNCLQWSNGSRDGSPTFVTVYDSGTVTITVNGRTASANYGAGSTSSTIASALVAAINADSINSSASSSSTGAVISLSATRSGLSTNFPLSSNSWSTDNSGNFSGASFGGTPSGSTLTGGMNASGQTTYDSGSVWVTVGGFQATATYAGGGGDVGPTTLSSVVSQIVSAFNSSNSSPVTASASGSVITLAAKGAGDDTNYLLSKGGTPPSNGFSSPSFSISVSGPFLTGGTTPNVFTSPAVTLYSYDLQDNLTCVVQKGTDTTAFTNCASAPAAWRPRTFQYDSLSRIVSEINPESGTVCYGTIVAGACQKNGYDPNGNLITKTDARSITATMTYDALNRLLSKGYSDGTPAVTFIYDQGSVMGNSLANTVGRLAYSHTPNNTAASLFSYDPVGRVAKHWQCVPRTCGYELDYLYNLAGSVTSQPTGTGIYLTQTFDSNGHVTQISSSYVDANHPATIVSNVTYSPIGMAAKMTFGNALVESRAYNSRMQPCRINVNSSASALGTCADAIPPNNVLDLNAGFNTGSADNGDVTSLSAFGQQSFNRSYTYDPLNRLATMSAPGDQCSGLSWIYDAWGNRTAQNGTGGSCFNSSTPVNTTNQLQSPKQYDAAGNMTYDGVNYYAYDAENRLTLVNSGSTATYAYDANGQRVEQITPSGITEFLYDEAGRIITEFGPSNSASAYYIRLNGQYVALYENNSTYFVHSDHLGSTRLVSATNGLIVECDDYYPFGELIPCGNTSTFKYKFTGQEYEDLGNGTDIDNFLARYLTSRFGRFLSPDPHNAGAMPANPQSWNAYSYVLNDPLSVTDPSGMMWCKQSQNIQDGDRNQKPGQKSWNCISDHEHDRSPQIFPGYIYVKSPDDEKMNTSFDVAEKMKVMRMEGGGTNDVSTDFLVLAGGGRVAYLITAFLFKNLEAAAGDVLDTIETSPPTRSLSNTEIGKIIGLGSSGEPEDVQITEEATRNLTTSKIEKMISEGLTKEWTEGMLKTYENMKALGGKKLVNMQLIPRIALFTKLLELWPKK